MDRVSRDLAVTLVPEAEQAAADRAETMCQCGTNCTVCTGTGSRGCERIIGDEALEDLLGQLEGP